MSIRRDLARRPAGIWAARLGLAGIATVLGYASLTFAIAQGLGGQDPALAHRLAPYDGRITAAYAKSLAGYEATAQDRARADALAKLALRQDPTTVAAVATLGVNAAFRGDTQAARRYFAYAQTLSRRDLRTQLWMIEDAVGRGDVPEALRQYDITLRVHPGMGEVLYPVLVSAATDPLIRRELVSRLARKPIWSEAFITFAAANNPDPRSTAALFLGLRRTGVTIPETAFAGAVNALIAAGQPDNAWFFYAAARPAVDRGRSRDPRFAAALETPSQLDWMPITDGGVTASIQNGLFDFAAPASIGGPVLQQLQVLPPGRYRLIGHGDGIEQAEGARPYWVLTCHKGRELGRVEVPNSSVANGVFAGVFTVPADCPVQSLMLVLRPSDAVSGVSGRLDRVDLTSISQ
jgi:hypothetical protein